MQISYLQAVSLIVLITACAIAYRAFQLPCNIIYGLWMESRIRRNAARMASEAKVFTAQPTLAEAARVRSCACCGSYDLEYDREKKEWKCLLCGEVKQNG